MNLLLALMAGGCAQVPTIRDTYIQFHAYSKTPGLTSDQKEAYSQAYSDSFSVFHEIGLTCGTANECRPARFLNLLYQEPNLLSESLESVTAAARVMEQLPGGQALANNLKLLPNEMRKLNLWGKKVSLKQFECLVHSGRESFLSDENPGLSEVEFDQLPLSAEVKAQTLAMVQKIVEDEDNSWGDTILEGPYAQIESAEATDIQGLVFEGTVYGYQIRIAARGIYTEIEDDQDCTFNEDSEEWEGEDCSYGTISSFVTIDTHGNVVIQGEANFDD